jgi:hypothetical protein
MNYLSVGVDAKTRKGEKKGVLTGILYMSPAQAAGGKTMCPFSTSECRAVCLNTAGRGAFDMVQKARIRKTREFQLDPKAFVDKLREDVRLLISQAAKRGMIPAVRLNGTTDIEWEKYGIIQDFPDVQFYDYTKYPPTMRANLPPNYHLTFSYSEAKHSPTWAMGWLARGVNTAVVFNQTLPDTFQTIPVINGDESDLRFTDPKGVIVGLKTKGKARSADVGPGHFVQLGKAA